MVATEESKSASIIPSSSRGGPRSQHVRHPETHGPHGDADGRASAAYRTCSNRAVARNLRATAPASSARRRATSPSTTTATCWWSVAGRRAAPPPTPPRRSGADVVLLERYNHLGGLSTGGLVIWIDRMTDWTGRQVIRGFADDDPRPPAGRGEGGTGARRLGLARSRARHVLGFADLGLPRHRLLGADDRSGAAQGRHPGNAARGRRAHRAARLGGTADGRGRTRQRGAVREQGRPTARCAPRW